MKRSLLIAVVSLIHVYQFAQVTVTVDTSKKKQTIRGMGCQWNTTPDSINDLLYDIGASSYRVFAGENCEGFWNETANDNADPDVLNLSAFTDITGANLQAVLKARNRGCTFFMTIGSPPGWMKDTTQDMYWMRTTNPAEKVIYRTHLDAGGKLKSDMYEEFGEFALGAAMKFKQQIGIDLFAVNFQNEPKFSEPFYSCVYTGPEAVSATKSIARKFVDNGITTKLIFPEHGLFEIFSYADWGTAANNDTMLTKHILAFATHSYGGKDPFAYLPSSGNTPGEWTAAWREANRITTYKKEIWMTEGGPSVDPTSTASDIQVALSGAWDFYKAMKFGNASLYSCRELRKNEPARYHSIKNYVRYIRSGSQRMETTCSDTVSILPLIFNNNAKGVKIMYIVNRTETEKKVKVNWSGVTGNFDIFQTTDIRICEWVGQADIADSITLPPFSISSLVKVSSNNLPVINPIDTIVILKNNTTKIIKLKGINNGGEGGQVIVMKAWSHNGYTNLFNSTNIGSLSGDSATLTLVTKGYTGKTRLMVSISDQSTAYDSMFNEKVISVPVYIIPFINKAPALNDIADQAYAKSTINTVQVLNIGPVSDGNDGSQKLTITVSSSLPQIATIVPQGSSILSITPKAEGTATVTVTLKDDGENAGGGVGSITKSFKLVIGSGIYSLDENRDEISVGPNPADDMIIITDQNRLLDSYTVLDMNGRTAACGNITDAVTRIAAGHLNTGLYLVQLRNKTSVVSRKVIINR